MASTSHVLARKYRPQIFADLVGQEALVRTITNAIEHNRLAHAYMLTGIRGVGKTSSARIIAKGLNCIGADGKGGMTPNPCGKCKHCVEIASDSHIDVIEIDAASNTGVDNIREIIEGAKYNPVSARFKIYIIDEVHMLSKAAFNALLKTLEEPPERIKFIFATTEIRKVPITILSRCQRFDLKRLDEASLTTHLEHIAQLESIQAETEALQLIARAGDGSCRDSLSLLDQAMTQFDLKITASDVRQMLGLSDRTSLFDLYDSLMSGDIQKALAYLDKQYESGADPLVVAQDLLTLTHWLTRVKIVPDLAQDITVPEAERVRGTQLATTLSMASLTAAWQLLLKGLNEVKQADNPLIALEMVLIRLAFLSELPTPAQILEDIKKNTIVDGIQSTTPMPSRVIRQISQSDVSTSNNFVLATATPHQGTSTFSNEGASPSASITNAAVCKVQAPMETTGVVLSSLTQLVDLAKKSGDRLLAYNIETCVRPLSIENSILTCSFTPEAPRTLSGDLVRFLKDKTGVNWEVRAQSAVSSQTLKEVQAEKKDLLINELQQTPLVKGILEAFAGAKLGRIKELNKELPDDFESTEKAIEE